MDGRLIIARVADFLRATAKGETKLTEAQIERFGELAKNAIRRSFGRTSGQPKHTIRASVLGRPICQQQMDQILAPGEEASPFEHFKLAYGELVEALATVIMEGASLPIEAMQQGVQLELLGQTFSGTYDFLIDGKIYDFKTASDWSFRNKFADGLLAEEIEQTGSDEFGYGLQGQFYQQAAGYPFDGWIVVNKSTGEWTFSPIVLANETNELTARVHALTEGLHTATVPISGSDSLVPQNINPYGIKRQFDPGVELFRKKPTGNLLLPNSCTFCKFKRSCWENLEYRPSLCSEARNPAYKYYIHIENNEDGKDEVTT